VVLGMSMMMMEVVMSSTAALSQSLLCSLLIEVPHAILYKLYYIKLFI
jgi:hypothetical protein